MDIRESNRTDHDALIQGANLISHEFVRILEVPRGHETAPETRHYRDLMDAMGVALYTTDANGVITYYNDAAVKIWGRHPEIGKDLWCGSWKIYHLDGVTIMPHGECPMAVCLKENRPVRGAEAIAERPDGTRVYFQPFPTPLRDASGRLVGAVNVLVDITDRKLADQALRESESRLSVAMAAGQMGSWEWRISDNNVTWSDALESIHGLEAGTFGGTFEDFLSDVHPHDRAMVQDTIAGSLESGTHEIEYRIIRPDGQVRWVLGRGQLLRDPAGEPVRMVGVCMDITERKQAELAALRLGAIVESSDDAIVGKDLDGIVTSWNPGAERIFGYTAEEMVGQSIRRIIPPDRQTEEDRVLARLRSGERVDHFETIRRKKDGTEFPISLTVSPVKDRAGRIIGASKIARDITDRVGAEHALRESEERLRLAQSIARVGTFEWNIETGVNVWTPDLEAIYGLAPGEFAGTQRAWQDLIHPDDRASVLAHVEEAVRTGLLAEHEWRVVWPDGSVHWVAGRYQCVGDPDGKPLILSGVNIDITERKLAEEALRTSEESLREERDNLETINRISTVLSAELDLDRLIQSLTDEATRLVGAEFGAFFYNVVDNKGESYMLYAIAGVPREAFDKFPMPRNTALLAPTFAGEGIVRLDDVRQDPRYGKNAPYYGMPQGHLPVVSYLAVPVTSRSGKVLGGLFFGHRRAGVFTERHEKILEGVAGQTAIAIENARLFDQLQKSMDIKDQFLGLVSHELRTPITTILGNALLLQRRGSRLTEQSKQQAIGDVADEAGRLERIIENLLLLTRIDAGEQVDSEPIRLQPLVTQAIDSFQRRNAGRTITVSSDNDVPIALGRAEFVTLVLDNLITNADKYSPGEAPIEILVRHEGDSEIEVCVRDHGIGLDDDDLKEVFTPFYRSPKAKSQAKGIGLGLAVCKRVIEAQGGSIRAIARPEGGCDFIFKLHAYSTVGQDGD
jgi:PAS domain S-box-containing protein